MAQPFFQCTPPLLSATWFAPDEPCPASFLQPALRTTACNCQRLRAPPRQPANAGCSVHPADAGTKVICEAWCQGPGIVAGESRAFGGAVPKSGPKAPTAQCSSQRGGRRWGWGGLHRLLPHTYKNTPRKGQIKGSQVKGSSYLRKRLEVRKPETLNFDLCPQRHAPTYAPSAAQGCQTKGSLILQPETPMAAHQQSRGPCRRSRVRGWGGVRPEASADSTAYIHCHATPPITRTSCTPNLSMQRTLIPAVTRSAQERAMSTAVAINFNQALRGLLSRSSQSRDCP